VGSVTLPDASNGGAALPMRAEPDGLLIVYFGYTSCPDVCPTTMSEVGQAIRALPTDLTARIDVAMVTLDPDRDTADRLTDYLGHFFARSHAVRTTDADQLDAAAAAFQVRFSVEEHQPGSDYKVSHTAVTYGVDETGTVRVEWPFGMRSDAITSDLLILLAE
jgi:protein SCO1/2